MSLSSAEFRLRVPKCQSVIELKQITRTELRQLSVSMNDDHTDHLLILTYLLTYTWRPFLAVLIRSEVRTTGVCTDNDDTIIINR